MRANRSSRSVDTTLQVSSRAAVKLQGGHPWLFREQLEPQSSKRLALFKAGDVVQLAGSQCGLLGSAIVDPESPLVARLWSQEGEEPFGKTLLDKRLLEAWNLRNRLISTDTNAFRVVHGEADRMPGVVLDKYDRTLVMRLDGPAIAAWTSLLSERIHQHKDVLSVDTLLLRRSERSSQPSQDKVEHLWGAKVDSPLRVQEHGVLFVVDVLRGQKTGAFLDQRDNRLRVQRLAKGRKVLNLFSYTAGFSLHAAIGGAAHCTSVDMAPAAHATAEASFRLAGIDPDKHAFVTADVFSFLERAHQRGERYDLIVSDPPNMAPNEASKNKAIQAYKKLHLACASLLNPEGILCAASCSSHVHQEEFISTLANIRSAHRRLRVVEVAGAGVDHPLLPSFPEGHYLKFCVLI